MEVVASERNGCQLFVGDLDATGVVPLIESGLDLEAPDLRK